MIRFLKSSVLIIIMSVRSSSLFNMDGSWCDVGGLGHSAISFSVSGCVFGRIGHAGCFPNLLRSWIRM